MEKKALQQQIKELTREIERICATELSCDENEVVRKPGHSFRSVGPLGLFLVGLLGFTMAYFSLGEGPVAYLFIFGVATPGALWLMVRATHMPRWSRWRTKDEAVKRLNELTLEKRRLVKELRRLEAEERKMKR